MAVCQQTVGAFSPSVLFRLLSHCARTVPSFISPSPFLSSALHFLTFTRGQQTHPSYQQISSEEKGAGLEMHVPASDGF